MKLEEYKKKKLKIYKLNSGLVVKTKSLSPYTIMKIEKNFENKKENKGKDFWDSTFVIDELFHHFLVEPKVPEEMEVNDFLKEDFILLHKEILNQITFTETKKELKEISNSEKKKEISKK